MAPSICEEAALKLETKSVIQCYQNRPQECPTDFFPREKVVEELMLSARKIYLCDCETCKRLSGIEDKPDNRASRIEEIETKLLGEFLLIFALLILYRKPGLITEFIDRNVKLDGSKFLDAEHLCFLHKLKGVIANEADYLQRRILQDQFKFQIRELNVSTEILEYDQKEIVPIHDNDTIEGKGQFGTVIGFEFPHRDYEGTGFKEFEKGTRPRFVRKIFSSKKVDAGKAEWDVYVRVVNPTCNPHLMQALSAFSHGECFSIIFLHADSTFETLLKSDEPELTSRARWEQMTEVTKALACLHEAKIYHSDLKPQNLLIQDGQIKISDFGSAQDTEETENAEEARILLAARIYSPRKHEGESAYDVYSLGAMLSELAAADIQGRDGLIDYRNTRSSEDDESLIPQSKCFYLHKSGELKTAVRDRHVKLLALPDELSLWQRGFYTRDLFNLIENMLAGNSEERPSAKKVHQTLEKFIHQASGHSDEQASSSQPKLKKNIWYENRDQLIASGDPHLDLCASYCEKCVFYCEKCVKCRIFIYQRGTHQALRITFCYYLEGNTSIPDSHSALFCGKAPRVDTSQPARQIMGIIPCSTDPKLIKLLYHDDSTESYRFRSNEDAFRFQRKFTHYHVHESLSYQASFKFKRKPTLGNWIFSPFIRSHCEPKIHEGQIQLWTSEEISQISQIQSSFNMKIAIITTSVFLLAVPGNTKTYKLSVEGPSPTELSLEASVLERDFEKGMSHNIISDLNEMDHDVSIHFPDANGRNDVLNELKILDNKLIELKREAQRWNRGDD